MDHDDGAVVASHSNAHALQPHRRNLTDAQIRAIAARDGLVGVVLYNPFLADGPDHARHACSRTSTTWWSSSAPDHVGIGSDLDGGFTHDGRAARASRRSPTSGASARRSARATCPSAIEKILGGNWLRVLRRVLPE